MALRTEVAELIEMTRRLTSEAYRLSRSINETVEELQEFTEDVRRGRPQDFGERRRHDEPFEGDNRRA